MSYVNNIRCEINESRKITRLKRSERKEHLLKIKDELFNKLSAIYLNDILLGINRANERGKSVQHINHNREDLKVKYRDLGTPADLMREWLNEVKNPNSKYVLKEDDKVLCLEGVEAYVWNNRRFTTEYTWGESNASCKHYGKPCNCLRLKRNDIGLKLCMNYNENVINKDGRFGLSDKYNLRDSESCYDCIVSSIN